MQLAISSLLVYQVEIVQVNCHEFIMVHEHMRCEEDREGKRANLFDWTLKFSSLSIFERKDLYLKQYGVKRPLSHHSEALKQHELASHGTLNHEAIYHTRSSRGVQYSSSMIYETFECKENFKVIILPYIQMYIIATIL